MAKEITFRSDINLDSSIHSLENSKTGEDLGVEVIEQVPDVDTLDQFEVTLKRRREATREKLAYVFVIGLFLLIISITLLAFLSNETQVKNMTEMILAVSGVLSGPLGFIIGYYFKKQEESSE